MRSFTSPITRSFNRPPSTELSSNLDCAFPPFPASGPSTASTSRSKSPSRSEYSMDSLDRKLQAQPKTQSNVMQKMNTIAPGPFQAKRRQGSNGSTALGENKEQTREAPGSRVKVSGTDARANLAVQSHISRPSTASSEQSNASKSREAPPPRPERPAEPIDGFLAALKGDPVSQQNWTAPPLSPRPNTFPLVQDNHESSESTTQPALRRSAEPASRPRRPTLMAPSKAEPSAATMLPSASLVDFPVHDIGKKGLPPRTVSRNDTGMDYRLDHAPPVPAAATLPSHAHAAHFSSGSASSVSSVGSYGGRSAVSGPSPTTSAASSISMLSTTAEDQSKAYDSIARVAPLQPQTRSNDYPLGSANPSPASQAPATARQQLPASTHSHDAGLTSSQSSVVQPPSPPKPRYMEPPESPMDPAFQKRVGRPSRSSRDPPTWPQQGQTVDQAMATTKPAAAAGKRPGTAAKHQCRGCKEPITGKSVRAADGRLTGRYHKQC